MVGNGTYLDTNTRCLVYLGTIGRNGKHRCTCLSLSVGQATIMLDICKTNMEDKCRANMELQFAKWLRKRKSKCRTRRCCTIIILRAASPSVQSDLTSKFKFGSANNQIVQRQEDLSLRALFLIRIHCISVFQLSTPRDTSLIKLIPYRSTTKFNENNLN